MTVPEYMRVPTTCARCAWTGPSGLAIDHLQWHARQDAGRTADDISPMATILLPQQRRDIVTALTIAIDDLTERVIPDHDGDYDAADIAAAEARARRYVDLINFLELKS